METEGGVRNTKPLGSGMSGRRGSSHFQCAFSRKKRKEDLTRPISTREAILRPCEAYADDVVVHIRVHLHTPADSNLILISFMHEGRANLFKCQ